MGAGAFTKIHCGERPIRRIMCGRGTRRTAPGLDRPGAVLASGERGRIPPSRGGVLRRGEIHQGGDGLAVAAGGAEGDLVGLGSFEVEMRGVLPGHADAAVELHALLGGPYRDLPAVGLRDGHGEGRIGTARALGGQGVGGVPGRRAGRGDLEPEFGEPVLDRLERADGTAELIALPRVPDGFGKAPLGDAELFGGEQPGPGEERRVDGRRGALLPRDTACGRLGEGDARERARAVEWRDAVDPYAL